MSRKLARSRRRSETLVASPGWHQHHELPSVLRALLDPLFRVMGQGRQDPVGQLLPALAMFSARFVRHQTGRSPWARRPGGKRPTTSICVR